MRFPGKVSHSRACIHKTILLTRFHSKPRQHDIVGSRACRFKTGATARMSVTNSTTKNRSNPFLP